MHCSLKGPGWATARQCNQYPEYCTSDYIGNITAPYQQQYIDDYARSGTHAKGGNGGFFHSCCARANLLFSLVRRASHACRCAPDLGSYFHSGWGGTAIWNIIKINGLSMRQAIGNWWRDGETPPAVRCKPNVEHCPGGAVCPASGVCPSHTHADGAAWTTDCTWDPVPQEPPKWTNKTCEDWQYDANHTGKPGCCKTQAS